MPVINRNTPTEQITVPVPTPVQTKPKSQGSAPPAVQQVQQRRPTQHPPISFGGENDEFGRPAHQLSAVIMPWVPNKAKQLSRRNPKRYAGETTEEDFHRLLDANPNDHHTRLVFADWLQERNDPRAEGYRALGQLQKRPNQSHYSPSDTWVWARIGNVHHRYGMNGSLPESWLKRIINNHPRYGGSPVLGYNYNWRYHNNRREADDAAALAFRDLPEQTKNRLLKPKQLSRKRIQVITYKRPNLTPAQKDRAKKIELVVLPTGIEGKKCGTCKYAKHHKADKSSNNLYCFNNQVHMNVKSNWGCKLWDTKGVKRLSRKSIMVKKYGRAPEHEIRPFVHQVGGLDNNRHADAILADKFDDYDDPRSIIVRRDLSYSQHPRGWASGRADHINNELLPPNDNLGTRRQGPFNYIDTGDSFRISYEPWYGSGHSSETHEPSVYSYYLHTGPSDNEIITHGAYLTPEEHQRIMDEFGHH